MPKNETRKVVDIPPDELSGYITEFIVAVRGKDGKDFEPSSLRGLICSLNRHLKVASVVVIFVNTEFEQGRQALEARSKEKRRQKKQSKRNRSYNRLRSNHFIRKCYTHIVYELHSL